MDGGFLTHDAHSGDPDPASALGISIVESPTPINLHWEVQVWTRGPVSLGDSGVGSSVRQQEVPSDSGYFFLFFSKEQEDVYFMKGAFEEVIHHCSMYNNGGIPLPLTPQQKSYWQQEEKKMGSLGLRGWCHGSLLGPLGP